MVCIVLVFRIIPMSSVYIAQVVRMTLIRLFSADGVGLLVHVLLTGRVDFRLRHVLGSNPDVRLYWTYSLCYGLCTLVDLEKLLKLDSIIKFCLKS